MRANAPHHLSVELWPVRNTSKETLEVDKIEAVLVNVQSSFTSSISNLQFGATQVG